MLERFHRWILNGHGKLDESQINNKFEWMKYLFVINIIFSIIDFYSCFTGDPIIYGQNLFALSISYFSLKQLRLGLKYQAHIAGSPGSPSIASYKEDPIYFTTVAIIVFLFYLMVTLFLPSMRWDTVGHSFCQI